MNRLQFNLALKDLEKKMVFIVGPRQSGKTYLAKQIATKYKNPTYLNYDKLDDRKIITESSWHPGSDLIILDELHKMPEWKNYIKGIYDTKPEGMHILVTGSARMEIFKNVDDSLAGRYFIHHLFPISIAELHLVNEPLDLAKLIMRGGFPEPYLAETEIDVVRWRNLYLDSLISTDVLNFDNIQNLKAMKMLVELLRHRVGSPISYNSLAGDLNLSSSTIKKYVDVLEALHIVFRITPFSKNIARSLLKEPKIYFFDNGLVEGNEGVKFENLMAISLLKHCYFQKDTLGLKTELYYLRTKEKREVDFALTENGQITQIIEAKNQNPHINPPLKWFVDNYDLKGIQVVNHLRNERQQGDIDILCGLNYLKSLSA